MSPAAASTSFQRDRKLTAVPVYGKARKKHALSEASAEPPQCQAHVLSMVRNRPHLGFICPRWCQAHEPTCRRSCCSLQADDTSRPTGRRPGRSQWQAKASEQKKGNLWFGSGGAWPPSAWQTSLAQTRPCVSRKLQRLPPPPPGLCRRLHANRKGTICGTLPSTCLIFSEAARFQTADCNCEMPCSPPCSPSQSCSSTAVDFLHCTPASKFP